MGRSIKINCKRVYDVGSYYKNGADTLRQIKKEMIDISSSVANSWEGADSNNFVVKYNSHIHELDNLIFFLDAKSELLKKMAINHGVADDNFSTNMKRNDQDE